jgi:hypothetical protein
MPYPQPMPKPTPAPPPACESAARKRVRCGVQSAATERIHGANTCARDGAVGGAARCTPAPMPQRYMGAPAGRRSTAARQAASGAAPVRALFSLCQHVARGPCLLAHAPPKPQPAPKPTPTPKPVRRDAARFRSGARRQPRRCAERKQGARTDADAFADEEAAHAGGLPRARRAARQQRRPRSVPRLACSRPRARYGGRSSGDARLCPSRLVK